MHLNFVLVKGVERSTLGESSIPYTCRFPVAVPMYNRSPTEPSKIVEIQVSKGRFALHCKSIDLLLEPSDYNLWRYEWCHLEDVTMHMGIFMEGNGNRAASAS